MTFLQAIILGLIQGLTEFIPVSSSGHLALIPKLFGWETQPTSFDIILHAGTLFALLIYFFPKLKKLFKGIMKKNESDIDLGKKIIIGSAPAAILGIIIAGLNFATNDRVDQILKSNIILISMLILIGLLFILADSRIKNNTKKISEIGIKNTIIIGLTQCLSLIRGTSRSGITILTGIKQGLSRKEAAEFSFLMGIPLLSFAVFYQIGKFALQKNFEIEIQLLIVGFITSFISGYFAIKFMMKFLQFRGLAIFGIYRIILAIIAIIILF